MDFNNKDTYICQDCLKSAKTDNIYCIRVESISPSLAHKIFLCLKCCQNRKLTNIQTFWNEQHAKLKRKIKEGQEKARRINGNIKRKRI